MITFRFFLRMKNLTVACGPIVRATPHTNMSCMHRTSMLVHGPDNGVHSHTRQAQSQLQIRASTQELSHQNWAESENKAHISKGYEPFVEEK